MGNVLEYKCPACGGIMEFDSKSQKMKCPYCDMTAAIEEFETQGQEWKKEETEGLKVYVCRSCGGELVADENTGASSCPFCGNPVVMKGQFEGDLKPDYIIPFRKDKKEAKTAYQEHLKGKPFLPAVFSSKNHIDEIKGVYVPFWLFDVKAKADMNYKAEKIRIWKKGDTEYTETRYYDIHRKGSLSFEKVPADGSKKMDDTLMQSIEPFNFKDAKEFKAAYLSGYLADRYDVTAEQCEKQVKKRIEKSVKSAFAESVKGYQAVSPAEGKVNLSDSKYKYVLYPVWMLTTTWKEQKFVFAMNGQSGKFIGDLPVDKNAFWRYVAKWSVILGAIGSIAGCVLLW